MEKITTYWRYWDLTKYSKKENLDMAKDPIITSIDEYKKKLKLATWDQMGFLSEEIGIDDPAVVIREIRDALSNYYLEYFLGYENIDDSKEGGDPDTIDVLKYDKKLKLAVWCYMRFLMEYVGINEDAIMDLIDESIEKYIREYSPRVE
jgi:hypothetical protein